MLKDVAGLGNRVLLTAWQVGLGWVGGEEPTRIILVFPQPQSDVYGGVCIRGGGHKGALLLAALVGSGESLPQMWNLQPKLLNVCDRDKVSLIPVG